MAPWLYMAVHDAACLVLIGYLAYLDKPFWAIVPVVALLATNVSSRTQIAKGEDNNGEE